MPEHSVEIANAVKDPSIEPVILRGAESWAAWPRFWPVMKKRCQAMMDEFKDHVAVRV